MIRRAFTASPAIVGLIVAAFPMVTVFVVEMQIQDKPNDRTTERTDRTPAEILADAEARVDVVDPSWIYVHERAFIGEEFGPVDANDERSKTQRMGEKYPHIVIEGEMLDYHPDAKWYFYAGTNQRAMWLATPRGNILLYPTRQIEHPPGSEEFHGGRWVKPWDTVGEREGGELPHNVWLMPGEAIISGEIENPDIEAFDL